MSHRPFFTEGAIALPLTHLRLRGLLHAAGVWRVGAPKEEGEEAAAVPECSDVDQTEGLVERNAPLRRASAEAIGRECLCARRELHEDKRSAEAEHTLCQGHVRWKVDTLQSRAALEHRNAEHRKPDLLWDANRLERSAGNEHAVVNKLETERELDCLERGALSERAAADSPERGRESNAGETQTPREARIEESAQSEWEHNLGKRAAVEECADGEIHQNPAKCVLRRSVDLLLVRGPDEEPATAARQGGLQLRTRHCSAHTELASVPRPSGCRLRSRTRLSRGP